MLPSGAALITTGKRAAMLANDVHPAVTIEHSRPNVLVHKALRFMHVLLVHHCALEVFEQVILQSKEQDLAKHSTARFQIAVHTLRSRRILFPVREFIAIGLKDKIARLSPEHRLHRSHAAEGGRNRAHRSNQI